jgi:hypothetical protein
MSMKNYDCLSGNCQKRIFLYTVYRTEWIFEILKYTWFKIVISFHKRGSILFWREDNRILFELQCWLNFDLFLFT